MCFFTSDCVFHNTNVVIQRDINKINEYKKRKIKYKPSADIKSAARLGRFNLELIYNNHINLLEPFNEPVIHMSVVSGAEGNIHTGCLMVATEPCKGL